MFVPSPDIPTERSPVKSRYFSIAAAFALASTAVPASAFDGQVQGFLLGAGIGPTFLTSHTFEFEAGDETFDDDLKTEGMPIQFNWLIGGAWDNQSALFYSGHASYYTIKEDDNLSYTSRGLLTYRRYFKPEGPSPYAEIGGGVAVFNNPDLDEPYIGGAFSVGGGYMFKPHYAVEFGLDWSSVALKEDFEGYENGDFHTITATRTIDLTSIYVTINALAF